MGWYDRQNTFKRTLANPYFQTKSGQGGGGSPLAAAMHPTQERSWTGKDYADLGGLLGMMGDDKDDGKDGSLWTVTPEGQWALKSEEVKGPEEVMKLPQEEQQQYFRQMIYGDPRTASANQWSSLPDFLQANYGMGTSVPDWLKMGR